jgi:hypothetical protein
MHNLNDLLNVGSISFILHTGTPDRMASKYTGFKLDWLFSGLQGVRQDIVYLSSDGVAITDPKQSLRDLTHLGLSI